MIRRFLKKITFALIANRVELPIATLDRLQDIFCLKQLLDSHSINCVLDVGANIGQTVSNLRHIGYRGYIISFEPISAVFAKLEQSCSSDPQWRGFNMALGDKTVPMVINVLPQATMMSSILLPKDSPGEMPEEKIQVNRLDEIFHSITSSISTPRVFLKMDTQGYDSQVFQGAAGCMSYIHGLQSEVSPITNYKGAPRYIEALQLYESVGFELFSMSAVSRRPSGSLQDMNCLMQRHLE